jgi:integrase
MSQRQTATGTVLSLVEEVLPDNVFRRPENGRLYGRIEIDGREVRKSLGTSDPVEAAEKVKKWLAEVSPKHASGELSFAQVASSWIETYRSEFTDKTWESYRQCMKMLNPFFGHLMWPEVTKAKINEFITERRKTVTVATVNRNLSVLSNIIEHAIDQDWADDNPLRSMSRKKRREKRDPFTLPTDAMIEWPWRHMRGTFGDLCTFALETGMRRDEIVYLDKRRNILFDRRAAQLFKTKTRQVRVVMLSEAALAIAKKQPGEGMLFRTRNGGHYKRVTEMWREVMIRAGKSWSLQHPDQPFIRFRFHDLRHIYAIRFLRSGGNIYVLQKQLGHSTIRQTEEYLQYLTSEEQAMVQYSEQQPYQQPYHSASVITLTRS